MIASTKRTMSRYLASMLLVGFVVSGLLAMTISRVFAVSAPNILSYQGRILNSNGVPVADTTASISFAFYTAASGGTCLWSNSSDTCATTTARTVTLTDGLFSENLGDTAAGVPYAAINDSVFADNAAVYLEIIVNTETLTPRKQIVAAPYAMNSDTLDGFNTTQVGGTTAAVPVLTSEGRLIVTGETTGSSVDNGSVYINAATTSTPLDTLFGIALSGSQVFRVNAVGNTEIEGTLNITTGTLSSTADLELSTAGDLIYVNAGDDFAVGSTTIAAPFSVDESANTVRIGDGTSDANDPSLTFYASDAADSGTLSFSDTDTFTFTGGNITANGNSTFPTSVGGVSTDLSAISTFTGTSNASLNTLQIYGLGSTTGYSGLENAVGTDHLIAATNSLLSISGGTTTLTMGFGARNRLINASTNASLVQGAGYMSATDSEFTQNAVGTTLALGYGVHGTVLASDGTLTKGVGISGQTATGLGTITTAYAGEFIASLAGSTRYGIFASASGGATANYAGYFTGSAVHVDSDETPDVADVATGAGDLFVTDALEADGSVSFGDLTGSDTITFNSAISGATTGATFTMNGLTSGSGMLITRGSGGSDFDGQLLYLQQANTAATSDADALVIENSGGGDATGIRIVQAQVTDETNAAGGTTLGAQALTLDITDAGGNGDAFLIRAGGQITFVVESDGSVLSDNAYSAAGADYAEYFLTNDATVANSEIVCHDRTTANAVKRCEAGNSEVVGIVSPTPGFIGNLPEAGSGSSTVIVGLNGQIDTYVSTVDGAIEVGDPITTSSSLAGYAGKAHGPVRIVGFALESLASGSGIIKVFVNPQWYGGDVLASDGSAIVSTSDVVLSPLATADAATSAQSYGISFRGSGWDGTGAVAKEMTLRTNLVDGDDAYRLSVVNDDGQEVAYVGESGDLAIAGKLYPSDRGTLQTSKYIYYDGSVGAGGDMMRTNASGWGSGSYDFAEMFPSRDILAAGEVVVFADGKEEVQRSTGATYDDRIAGIISTQPGFLAGENLVGHVPVALTGRVPTYVSGENGAISIGDPLTTSSKPGYAMKATEPGPIVGYAMEAFTGNTGAIIAVVRPSYYDGAPVTEAPAAQNTASQLTSISGLNVSGTMNLNGGSILSVASLSGIGGNWTLSENGDFVTRSRVTSLIRGYDGEDVSTVAALGRETTIQLSGTATLQHGMAEVNFETIDSEFSNVIANTVPYRVIVTPSGATNQLYVADRSQTGFVIREAGTSTGILVDWLVIAYHKDFAPDANDEVVLPVSLPEIIDVPTDITTEVTDSIDDETVDEPVVVPTEQITEPEVTADELPVEEEAVITESVVEVSTESASAETVAEAVESPVTEILTIPAENELPAV